MSASVDLGFDVADPSTYWPTAKRVVGYALGTGTPEEQMIANLVISFAAILSSLVSLGATLLVVLLTIPLFFIGVLRLWGPFNSVWPIGGA